MTEVDKNINDQRIKDLIIQNKFSDAAKRLIDVQKESWYMLAQGYKSLNSIKTKILQYEGFKFVIQYNPGRYTSSSALVDRKSIDDRECFLCTENLPREQEGIVINEYILLANPFPIFQEHFTISNLKHKDQRIKYSFRDLLHFGKLLSKHYTVFYNGPKCGASAPDHLHFQAGSKYEMPIEKEYENIKNRFGEVLSENKEFKIYGINDGLRKIIAIEGEKPDNVINLFNAFYDKYSLHSNSEEPLMNILCIFEEDKGWKVLIMLRAKHRPAVFYKEGEEKVLFSPAACDFGGLCITPLEKDFIRFDNNLLKGFLNEVSISDIKFQNLKEDLKSII
jgi:hypothetical protein